MVQKCLHDRGDKMTEFKHSYTTEMEYVIIEYTERFSPRKVSPEYCDYLTYITEGNIPEKISGNEFVIITDDVVTIDPDKDNILLSRKWATIRAQRDAKLTSCDWTQISDSPKYQDEDWLIYRQALRDITEQENPYNIVWPEEPTEAE